MTHIPSDYILSKIKEFEGCSLRAYICPGGELTIGYGITNADINITGTKITQNLEISKETAELWLKKSLIKKYSPLVDKYDKIYNWNQNQFDALLSFAFNIGSIDQLTNNGKRTVYQISNKIPEYNKSKGKVLKGLIKRREFEKKLFDTPLNNNIETVNNKKPLKSNEEIVDEIINGKWGNGKERKIKIEQAGYNYQEIQNEVNKKLGLKNKSLKSNDEIADEVIKGEWGIGEDRKIRLNEAGYNYQEIQNIVNFKLGSRVKTNNEINKQEIANKVIKRYYGNGEQRKKKLESEGYNYREIQTIVNSLLKK